jgi:exoribonuclease R
MQLVPLRRGTTTYLVQRRLDMLPKPLTEAGRYKLTHSLKPPGFNPCT